MKRRFIRRFIITLETCIDALALRARDTYSTGFLGDNKSPYKPLFHRITYMYSTDGLQALKTSSLASFMVAGVSLVYDRGPFSDGNTEAESTCFESVCTLCKWVMCIH